MLYREMMKVHVYYKSEMSITKELNKIMVTRMLQLGNQYYIQIKLNC